MYLDAAGQDMLHTAIAEELKQLEKRSDGIYTMQLQA